MSLLIAFRFAALPPASFLDLGQSPQHKEDQMDDNVADGNSNVEPTNFVAGFRLGYEVIETHETVRLEQDGLLVHDFHVSHEY